MRSKLSSTPARRFLGLFFASSLLVMFLSWIEANAVQLTGRECAFVLTGGPDTLHVIDMKSRRLIRNIPLFRSRSCPGEAPLRLTPRDVAVSSDGRNAFITTGACVIFRVDLETSSLTTIPFGSPSA